MEAGHQPDRERLGAWRSIWWKPQATITALVSRNARISTLVLAVLAGISSLITTIIAANPNWIILLLAAAIAGPFLGLLWLYLDGLLLSWTGRPLGGVAKQSALRTAVAWASVPSVATLGLLLAGFALFQQGFVSAYGDGRDEEDPIIIFLILAIGALVLWGLFLKVRTVGAVQNFGVIRSVANIAAALLLPMALAVAFRAFLFQPFSLPSSSMEPTLIVGDQIFVDKRIYGFSRFSLPFDAGFDGRVLATSMPERGDIVVFKLPTDTRIDYVKRVVGLPGDAIEMKHGVLHINGTPVQMRHAGDFSSSVWTPSGQTVQSFEETLPGGRKHLVLDSDPNGHFDNTDAVQVPPGHYFMLGDNRDNSMDSRSRDQVGFIPADHILGRVSIIHFSASRSSETASIADALAAIRWDRMFRIPK